MSFEDRVKGIMSRHAQQLHDEQEMQRQEALKQEKDFDIYRDSINRVILGAHKAFEMAQKILNQQGVSTHLIQPTETKFDTFMDARVFDSVGFVVGGQSILFTRADSYPLPQINLVIDSPTALANSHSQSMEAQQADQAWIEAQVETFLGDIFQ